MAFIHTMTASSVIPSPFRDPANQPDAFGSHTSCQGPPAKPHTSPLAKFRKHIASTFAPSDPTMSTQLSNPEPFDPNIVDLSFVPERSSSARACSAPPAACKVSKHPATSDTGERVVADDFRKQPKPNREARRPSSRASMAHTSRCASTTNLLGDDMRRSRPATAGGDDGCPPNGAGQPGGKGCQCPCGCAKCRFANTKLCRCACSCNNCRCQSKKLSNKILRMLEDHRFTRRPQQ